MFPQEGLMAVVCQGEMLRVVLRQLKELHRSIENKETPRVQLQDLAELGPLMAQVHATDAWRV